MNDEAPILEPPPALAIPPPTTPDRRRSAGAARLLFVYWFYTTAFALTFAVPIFFVLTRHLGHSLYAAEMQGLFDPLWFPEFTSLTRGWPATMLAGLSLILGAGYMLLTVFLNGGAIAFFATQEPYKPAIFYAACAHHFGRLFRLLLVSLIFYTALLALNNAVAAAGRKLFADSMEERPVVLFSWFRNGLSLLLFLLLNMVFDYAKIHLVAEDRRSALRATVAAFRFVIFHFRRTATLYFAITALALGLLAAYRALAWLPLGILLQQAYVLGRIGTRLLYFSAQTNLYRRLAPPAAAERE